MKNQNSFGFSFVALFLGLHWGLLVVVVMKVGPHF